jgi:hypothetical protein
MAQAPCGSKCQDRSPMPPRSNDEVGLSIHIDRLPSLGSRRRGETASPAMASTSVRMPSPCWSRSSCCLPPSPGSSTSPACSSSLPPAVNQKSVGVSVSKLCVGVERFECSQPISKNCVRGVGVHVWPVNAWAGCVCEF